MNIRPQSKLLRQAELTGLRTGVPILAALKPPKTHERSSEVPPLYKHTMTPPCRHSTEQCTSAGYEQKNCTNIQNLRLRGVIGGMGKQEQDRKESGAIVEWPYRLSLWQGHYWTLGPRTRTHAHRFPCPPWKLTRRVCRWTRCSFPRPSSRWTSRTSVSPSDAWPAWTWPSEYLEDTFHTQHCAWSHVRVCVSLFDTGLRSSGVTYQWSFPRWRREWLHQAISAQLGMWPLGEYGFSWHSHFSHLFQLGSWHWQLLYSSSLEEVLTEGETVETVKLLYVLNSW